MLAYVNKLCLRLGLVTGLAHYYSRGSGRVWLKGATSSNLHLLVSVSIDCDADALLFGVLVASSGVTCHTLKRSCFHKRLW
ncbi:MAG: phosphoribosyl-AMP cyclohydrolase [Candidatus Hodgkinia cicadicola]|nr:MAG: phosphoribosyl-AMP cyclohydrolase [Candidatus Hodgkinia cicadicola]